MFFVLTVSVHPLENSTSWPMRTTSLILKPPDSISCSKGCAVIRVKPNLRITCYPFLLCLPLSLSINLRAPIWDVPLHLMWQQLAGGLLSLWADGRSTPLIPVHMVWMEQTEDSSAWGSNRPALPLLWPLNLLFFIGKEERRGEEGKEGGIKKWGVSFPMRMLTGEQGFLRKMFSQNC